MSAPAAYAGDVGNPLVRPRTEVGFCGATRVRSALPALQQSLFSVFGVRNLRGEMTDLINTFSHQIEKSDKHRLKLH